jgi:hypothetical protein
VGACSIRFFLRAPGFRPRAAGAAIGIVLAACAAIHPADANFTRRSREAARTEQAASVPPGQLHVVINIGKQQLSLYSDGMLVTRSPVSTGTTSHPTPTGVFSIIQKKRHHVSNLYFAQMPFMQRLTWSGVALHQGNLPGYAASHGCVRLPAAFAQTLWKTTKVGARVIIARQDTQPYPFSHAALPMPISAAAAAIPSASGGAVKTAQAETVANDASKSEAPAPDNLGIELPAYPPLTEAPLEIRKSFEPNIVEEPKVVAEPPLPAGPVSVFVSRKLKRMYVRKGFKPLFDAPIAIKDESKPFGTHVFTATAGHDGALRWLAVSLPVDALKAERGKKISRADIMREETSSRARRNAAAPAAQPAPAAPGASEVLDRIELPADEMQRVRDLIAAGATFMVSDHGLGDETGEGTDFVVLTR